MNTELFVIAPMTERATSLLLILPLLIVLLVIGVLGASVMGARSARFEVSPIGLRLRGDLYGRLIAAAALRTDEAKRIDFDASPDLRPRRRTMGTGLPGYRSGWFRLQNGESALVYLTDSTRAVYIPTSEGYSVLVTPSDPDAFLAAVRRLGRP